MEQLKCPVHGEVLRDRTERIDVPGSLIVAEQVWQQWQKCPRDGCGYRVPPVEATRDDGEE